MSILWLSRVVRTVGVIAPALLACSAWSCNRSGPALVASKDEQREAEEPAPSITQQQLAALRELSPEQLPAPPPDRSNRFADDARAARFGQRLFFDTSLSGALLDGDNDGSKNSLGKKGETGKVACAGCHVPEADFQDTRTIRAQISLGAGWGKRRAPSLLDVAQSKLVMWDGRHDALYNQIFSALESPVEMNSSRLYAARQVFARHRQEYEALFGPMPPLDDAKLFPALLPSETGCSKLDEYNGCKGSIRGRPGDAAEYDGMKAARQREVTGVIVNLGKAIGAYERLLSCGPGRFDRFMRGDAGALSHAEQRGAALFVGRAACVSCHSGPFFSDEKFHNVGLRAQLVATVFLNANDRGAAAGVELAKQDALNTEGPFSDGQDERLRTIGHSGLEGAFRTPRLRCVSRRPSFMHTGQFTRLADVVAFFDRGGDRGGYPGKNELSALGLTERERSDLTAFLHALDGPGPKPELLKNVP
jgi:cytochrome c peroxidase